MKNIVFGIVLGVALMQVVNVVSPLKAAEVPSTAEFQTEVRAAVPALETRRLLDNFTMTAGQEIVVSVTGRDSQSVVIPAGKTGSVTMRVSVEIK